MAIQFTVMSIDDEELAAPTKALFQKSEISIGRSRLNDLVLDHAGVSNTHARVRVENHNGASKFFVSDLDSTNGTMIGTKRLDPRVEIAVPERDRIMIAGYIVKVEYIPDPPADKSEKLEKPLNGNGHHPEPVISKLAEGKSTDSYVRPEEPTVEEVKIISLKREHPPMRNVRDELPAEKPAERIFEKPVERVVNESAERMLNQTVEMKLEQLSVEEKPKAPEDIPSFVAHATLLIDDSDIELDFVATQLLTLSGKILHRGSPLGGVRVSDPSLGAFVTDEKGEFSYKDILEGTPYSLTFEKDGFVFTTDRASGSLNDRDVSVDVVGKKLFTISGKITHKGRSLEGVTIDGGKLGIVVTDSGGVYRFNDVLEGQEYTLKATKDGYTFGTLRKKT